MFVSPAFAGEVVDQFFSWAELFDETAEPTTYDLLQDYIVTWFARDNCVEVTGGDYANYLLAVLIIVHAYEEKPERLDYRSSDDKPRSRRVRRLIDLTDGSAFHLDRQIYQREAFRQLAGLQD